MTFKHCKTLLQAMDNSIGNMGKQLGALVMSRGQQSSSLQQTPTVDAANSFQQVRAIWSIYSNLSGSDRPRACAYVLYRSPHSS